MKNLRFSRQVNYPDLAHNIQYLIYKFKAEGRSGWEGLDILDLAYRAESKTYKNFSIKCAVQYYPLYKYPLFKKMGFGNNKCINTEKFYNNMISFPFHAWMTNKEFNYLINSVKKSLVELRKK